MKNLVLWLTRLSFYSMLASVIGVAVIILSPDYLQAFLEDDTGVGSVILAVFAVLGGLFAIVMLVIALLYRGFTIPKLKNGGAPLVMYVIQLILVFVTADYLVIRMIVSFFTVGGFGPLLVILIAALHFLTGLLGVIYFFQHRREFQANV